MPVKHRTEEERQRHFWSKVAIGAEDKCWDWRFGTYKSGYGAFCGDGRVGKKNLYAHRVAYQYGNNLREPLEAEQVVMHTCDNRLCCNPGHLRIGTHADNVADMVAKGRMSYVRAKGTQQALAKLDEQKVREIRASTLGKIKLSRMYGVSSSVIVAVRTRRTWKHVE